MWRRVAKVVATAAGIGWVLALAIFLYIAPSRSHPDPSRNRVHRWPNHGSYVYLSDAEDLALKLTMGSAVALFVLAVIIDRRFGGNREQRGQDPFCSGPRCRKSPNTESDDNSPG
jgi:hypothetical protein